MNVIARIFLALSLCMGSASALAERELYSWFYPAVKVKEPDELSHFVYANKECPISATDLEELVNGVFIRSRIKPLPKQIYEGQLYLQVAVQCLKLEGVNPIFDIGVHFGRYTPDPPILLDRDFGTTGIGGKDYLRSAIKEIVEQAITEYIKANFDI